MELSNYNYVYNGSQLTQMTVGNDTLYFTYGILGPTTVTWNGTTYYYALNAQGDVIGIFDGNGNLVVTYNWDNAWGYNPMPEGIMATTIGALNPLRYRGYVYDTETGYYYLQSRYYDPEIGRFINADVFAATGQGLIGNNMFAYCGNNPVSRYDPSGRRYVKVPSLDGGSSGESGGGNDSTLPKTRDVTSEIDAALDKAVLDARDYKTTVNSLILNYRIAMTVVYFKFYTQVNHEAEWDIKYEAIWENKIGTVFPGQDVGVKFEGVIAAGFPTKGIEFKQETIDWIYITMGYEYAVQVYP